MFKTTGMAHRQRHRLAAAHILTTVSWRTRAYGDGIFTTSPAESDSIQNFEPRASFLPTFALMPQHVANEMDNLISNKNKKQY
jgi:hypothetical protein